MERYYGLIEVVLSFGGFCLFIVWQMRQLKRDVQAREEREREEARRDETPKS